MSDHAEELVKFSESEWVIPEGWTYQNDWPSKCRSCGAKVLWLESRNGKKSPHNPDGISHFATCPQASTWRKR